MNIILTFALLMIPGAVTSISVTGYSEGGVIITCKYEKQYTENLKFFCRGQWTRCSDLIRTNIKNKLTHEGRFSVYDDTSAAVFTVIIRDLKEEDSGTYYFRFYVHFNIYSYIEVNLDVKEGIQRRTVTGYSGGNIFINSKYEKKHTNSLKYVCKTTTAHLCFDQIYSKNISEWSHNDSLSIHDDKTAGLVQVFIRDLNAEDSGKYLMIFRVSEEYSFFSELNLAVKDDDCCEKVVSLSAPSGESVNISCRYPQSHSRDSKFFCRISRAGTCAHETQERQWQLYDDREDLLTVIISKVTDSAEYWCGVESPQQYKIFLTRVQLTVTEPPLSSDWSLIIILSVVLVVIFIGLVLLIVILYKRHPTRGADSSSQRENKKVSPTDCDYEEIKDIRLHNDSDTGRSAEYNTAETLTNTSDNALYSTVTYAVVNFHKKSDCVDRISFSNNQDYSEYATVNKAAV